MKNEVVMKTMAIAAITTASSTASSFARCSASV
jgi:hypothetical protein